MTTSKVRSSDAANPTVDGAAARHGRVCFRDEVPCNAHDGTVSPFADDFTNPIAVAFSGGRALALEFDSDGLMPVTGPGTTGSLYRIRPEGSTVLLLDGLFEPAALAIGPDGAF